MEQIAYIGLGSNLGDRAGYINEAVAMLGQTAGIKVLRLSSILETKPLGGIEQPNYCNAVVEIAAAIDAEAVHQRCHAIEDALGRVRTAPNSSRTIDLDLLLFGSEIIKRERLYIPHRDIHLRTFVLKGLVELAPDLVHPTLGRTMVELLARLNGCDFLLDPSRGQLVSIAGIIGVGKTTLARGLSESLGAKLLLEAYDTNPFLPLVYAGKKELALDCQLYFLASRVEALRRDVLAAGKAAVSDYVFDKEHIYAKRLLDARQYDLYCYFNRQVSEGVTPPVLLIYLKAAAEECLERIHQRNRPYEQQIPREFLEVLGSDYDQLVTAWTKCPVITIESDGFDARDSRHVARLAQEMKAYMVI